MTPNPTTPHEEEAMRVFMRTMSFIRNHNFEGASHYLSDDFEWKTPFSSFHGKQDWLCNFKLDAKPPTFDEPRIFTSKSGGGYVITRRGTKNVRFLTVDVLKTAKIDSNLKISQIVIRRVQKGMS